MSSHRSSGSQGPLKAIHNFATIMAHELSSQPLMSRTWLLMHIDPVFRAICWTYVPENTMMIIVVPCAMACQLAEVQIFKNKTRQIYECFSNKHSV